MYITGFDGLTIDGRQQSRIFLAENISLGINNLIITNGVAPNANVGLAGGISVTNVSVTNSTISGNSTSSLYASGGSFNFVNSILSGMGPGDDCFISRGILNIDSATITEDGSCRSIDPLVGPLADTPSRTLYCQIALRQIGCHTTLVLFNKA